MRFHDCSGSLSARGSQSDLPMLPNDSSSTVPLQVPTTATFLMFSNCTGHLLVGFKLSPINPLTDPVLCVLCILLWSSPTKVEATEGQHCNISAQCSRGCTWLMCSADTERGGGVAGGKSGKSVRKLAMTRKMETHLSRCGAW